MNFVCYNMADFCGKHFPEKWLIIWQGSHAILKARFAKFFRDLDARKEDYEIYNGHVIVDRGKGDQRVVIVYALDCKGFICEPLQRQNPNDTFFGEDQPVTVREMTIHKYPDIESADPTKHPAYLFVDAAHAKAVPFWEAIKTVPLIPVAAALTATEFAALGKIQIEMGCTQREAVHVLLEHALDTGTKAAKNERKRKAGAA